MKKIANFSVTYPVTILMIVCSILLLGYISFTNLGIDLFPDFNNPRLYVDIQSGDRPPEEIEKQFVEAIESQAIRKKNVVEVSSISRVGAAHITVEYKWNTDMDGAFLELQKALTSFSQNQDIDELNITQYNPNAAPVMLLGLSHPQISDMDDLRRVAENYIRNELIRLEGVAEVELSGEEIKEVVIETDTYLLQAYDLTADDLVSRINEYNQNVSGGSIVELGIKYIIKGVGLIQSLEDIENIIVTYRASQDTTSLDQTVPVYLSEVADVRFNNKEPVNIVRLNGKRILGLSVYKEMRFNTVEAVESILEKLDDIRKTLSGYELTVVQNQGAFITSAIREVEETALVGIFLAVLILYLFLRRVGATFVICIAIPVSIIATFNLMYFNGLTLNIMTLGGLALGAGMLVDNAIVVVENIYRHLEAGYSLKEASVLGTAQVGNAITASTITTIVVFLPIVYLHGASGELFKDQAWTVAFSLFSSLIVAILIIPMLSSKILTEKSRPDYTHSNSYQRYVAFLERVLQKKWLVIFSAAILVAGSILMLPVVGSEFMPQTEVNSFIIDITLPAGTELNQTEQNVIRVEEIISAITGEDLEQVYSHVGPRKQETIYPEDENNAHIQVALKNDHQSPAGDLMAKIGIALSAIPDLEAHISQEESALQSAVGSEEAPFIVEVKGEELDQIEAYTEQIKTILQNNKMLFNIETNFDEGQPEVNVVLDRVRAGNYNITINTIRNQLQAQLEGRDAGQWETGGELKDITIKSPDLTINQLNDIQLTAGGQNIYLMDVANIVFSQAPREIYRRNQMRIGRVTANVNKEIAFDKVVKQVEEELTSIDLLPEYEIEVAGEEAKRKESFAGLKFALILSVILVYMVLASQFESLLHPFTILLTIPLAVVGSIIIFFILGQTLNIMAYIGIIMLAGIAVNDSIILVDAITQLKREGLTRIEAILEGARRRIRPIIMTSLTTILALLPLTIGYGEGAALRSPMALAVIGGLVTSTILTLIVIPCVYMVLDQLRGRESQ
jgi:HAE1 family hydrophobic/amphiphilic exporter-1